MINKAVRGQVGPAEWCHRTRRASLTIHFRVINRDLLELRNLVECAELIARSALQRHESRGLHYSRDYPDTLPVSFPNVLVREVRSRNKAVQSLGLWRDMPR